MSGAPGFVLHCNLGTAQTKPTDVAAHGGTRRLAAEFGDVTDLRGGNP
jgi:hypothetical protein